MENTLTTESAETDVNTNEQESEQVEQVESQDIPAEETNADAYDDAWDNIDVNDPSFFEKAAASESTQSTEPESEQRTETAEEAAQRAFMEANPVLKFKGKDIPIDDPTELINLAQKGFLLETEMANIKPIKKVAETVSDVPLEVLQAVADLNQGKKEALDYIKQHYGIVEEQNDDFNFGEPEAEQRQDVNYKPEVPVENPIEEYWQEFSRSNTTQAAAVTEVFQALEPSFQSEIYSPELFPAFVQSVTSGEFESVYPLAIKEKSLNPAMSWVQAYAVAAQKVGVSEPEKSAPPKSASTPASTAPATSKGTSEVDRVWEDDEYYKELERTIFSN